MLLYGSQVLPLNSNNYKSLEFVINNAIRKIFLTNSNDVVSYCRDVFGIASVQDIIGARRRVFLIRIATVNSLLCTVWT